jgi:hypothetical protein
MATIAEIEAGEAIIKELEEIQRKIDLIESQGVRVKLTLQNNPTTIELPAGYSIAEITEVVRLALIAERSLKETELASI